jgi:mono/diheme cytochrome c family protein
MHRASATLVVLSMLALSALALSAQPLMAENFAPDQVHAGSSLYSRNCAICHGQHMQDPDGEIGAFDLRQFPHDQHDRFVASVSHGVNAMPAWGGLLKPAEVEALWAYVCDGEK